ncbi:adenylate/guanylate cyclase domain-containing protein [Nocardioides caldifontis]|uniref:adenylate/guanylate cyclase domain-containing protein n=1 Tax=Nocardioides caldifontis TaxID=2588938 RepID=UPI00193A92A5|nr:adenylate/guanylate cyclase domain-containing protein [Nocardioides caldifontis]
MADGPLLVALVVVSVVSLGAAVAAGVLAVRLRGENRRLREELEELRRPLRDAAPQKALQAAGWAVRTVVDTAGRVRERGIVGGLLLAPIEELTGWALQGEDEIAAAARPDGTVAFLFSDIEGSTGLNDRLGDREWVRVLAAHDRAVRAVVGRHGGHVVKTQGDGFMVAFGTPDQAVAAAVEVQRVVPARHRRLRRTGVRVRIGVHVGSAVSREGDYFGRNVAKAARVAARAEGGQVLVSEEVRAALHPDERLEVTPVGTVELKGLPGGHPLHAVAVRSGVSRR